MDGDRKPTQTLTHCRDGLELRALVLDKDPASRREIARWIDRLGLSVDCVQSGLQARRLIMERSYGVMVIDLETLSLHEESPVEIAREAQLPTIFVLLRNRQGQTLPPPPSDMELESDVAGVLDKPCDLAALTEMVQRALPVARGRARRRAGLTQELVAGNALLIDEQPAAATETRWALARLGLCRGVEHRTTLASALELDGLDELEFALVDLHLRDARGLDAVRGLSAAAPELPIVVLSGSTSEDLAEQALLVGAQEVLHKGADDDTLTRAVRRARLRKQSDRKMRYRASHDQLTGLYNNAHFRERIAQCVARAQRDNTGSAVLYLDLDGFKPVNDRYGHAAGDQVLQAVAGRMLEAVRTCDVAARLGGDEFAVLLEDVYDRKTVQRVVQRLLRSVSAPIPLANGEDVRVTTSVGVAMCPQAGTTADALIHAADASMLTAKRIGKSQYCFAQDSGKPAPAPRARLISELRDAVANGDFYVVYQPQMDIRTRQVVGLEALARWRRADGLRVGPEEFIPLLEDLDLIDQLGVSVLREACRNARAWSDKRQRDVRIAVNVSPMQLENPEFVETVMRILEQYSIAPERLELEVTEGTLMRQDARTRPALQQLRTAGVRIALDDFGTGYAALSYLREFSPDVIKIDRTFVDPLTTDERARVLVSAIINLARKLGIEVLAEGVENAQQLKYLREQGCDSCQGYLFGRPHFTGQAQGALH